jgi:CubicO group peptidase (beta-lactamase class C family)
MLGITRFKLLYLIAFVVCPLATFGKDTAMDKTLQQAFNAGELPGLHSVLVIHKGEVFAESYFKGNDERLGEPLGIKQHGPGELYDIRSVTKSIVGLLYGIALAEGKVPGLDESILAHFPQYSDLAKDATRKAIRIRDTLSMKMGTEWNEDLPYTDPKNSESAMNVYAKDRYRFALDRPMVHEPGTQWVYNGGAVELIAKLIADGVGKPIDQYADEKLFKPLGIKNYEWIGKDKVPYAASGLRLRTHDLAKIGQLILQNGTYGGQQIVPDAWLKESFTPRSTVLPNGLRYGYFWWLAPESSGDLPTWVAGFGNGGQRLRVELKNDLVVVMYAGNYNQADAWKLPAKVILELLPPALKAKLEKN